MNTLTSLQERYWLIDSDNTASRLFAMLRDQHATVMHPTSSRTLTFYDSFSWQLWFSDCVLYRDSDNLILRQLNEQQWQAVLEQVPLPAGPTPTFWWQLPESMAVLLQPHLKQRALLAQVKILRRDTRTDIKNTDNKTVARVIASEFRRANNNGKLFHSCISAKPIRGYDDAFRTVVKALDQLPLAPCPASPLHAYFESFAAWPKAFSAKPALTLYGAQAVRDVLFETVHASLQTARLCEDGIIKDIDIEFLHDYRVSIRAIRAVISLLAKWFPTDFIATLKDSFKEWGQRTNRLRDLDVYLLEENALTAVLPPRLTGAIAPLFEDMGKQRHAEFNKCRRYLQSQTYQHKMDHVASLVERIRSQNTPSSLSPASDVALKILHKQYRKVTKLGRSIHAKTTDHRIHALRIQGKKLRYVLEFFSSLLDPEKTETLLAAMRQLQNTLGEFNDLSVQQNALYTFYTTKTRHDALLGLAVGALIGDLYQRQNHCRGKIVKLFDRFDTPATRKNFIGLLRGDAR